MRVTLDKIASVTRNAALAKRVVLGDAIEAVPGAVVAVRVLDDKGVYNELEDLHGRMTTLHAGDVVAGVLGGRRALRGYAGVVPERVVPGDVLALLNLGGVIGRCTSANPDLGDPIRVEVLGAVLTFPELGRRVGQPATIAQGPVSPLAELEPLPPVVLVAGTCMHAGKTWAASTIVRAATRRGLRVGVAKLTGVALRRDTLQMLDHGAVWGCSFVDAGLPSTASGDVVAVARGCLSAVAAQGVDLIVAELGDGIMGDYGVREVLADPGIKAATRAVVLAATDPVAAWGGAILLDQLGLPPTAITGPATDNDAGAGPLRGKVSAVVANARTSPDKLASAVLGAAGWRDVVLEGVA